MLRKLMLIMVLITLLFPAGSSLIQAQGDTPAISPEAHGIDSAVLADMFALINADPAWAIDGLIITRDGATVIETYRHPFAADMPHVMYSVAKSFDSALTGIALDQGVIASLDTTLGEVYGTDHPATIEQLITMTPGVAWQEHPYTLPTTSWNMILQAPDPVDFFLNLDLKEDTEFNYCTGCMDMLPAIIEANNDQTARDFAQTQLFDPLGIDQLTWETYPSGLPHGGGLWLTLPELVRFGQLYLSGGVWNGQPIISADWVTVSTQTHVVFDQAQADDWFGAQGYGYGWWTFDNGAYAAMGSGGQVLYVLPEYELVIGIAASITGFEREPIYLVNDCILPALQADPLPENPSAAARLAVELDQYAELTPHDPGPLPPLAETISGQAFVMDENQWGFERVTLTFTDTHQALFEQTGQPFLPAITLGLDGVDVVNTVDELVIGGSGEWTGDNTFTMIWRFVGQGTEWHFHLIFGENKVTILGTLQSVVARQSFRLNGTLDAGDSE